TVAAQRVRAEQTLAGGDLGWRQRRPWRAELALAQQTAERANALCRYQWETLVRVPQHRVSRTCPSHFAVIGASSLLRPSWNCRCRLGGAAPTPASGIARFVHERVGSERSSRALGRRDRSGACW